MSKTFSVAEAVSFMVKWIRVVGLKGLGNAAPSSKAVASSMVSLVSERPSSEMPRAVASASADLDHHAWLGSGGVNKSR